jgi:signal peptidase II
MPGKSSLDKRLTALFFGTAALVAGADQLTKLWIKSYPEGDTIFRAGFFRIVHIGNTGAAFGLLQDKSFFLSIVAVFGIILLLFLAFPLSRRMPFLNNWKEKTVLGLILGGVIGNLTDRLHYIFDSSMGNLVRRISLGHVTDFLDFGYWPVFNVADSAVTVGTILFAYLFLFANREEQPVNTPEDKNIPLQ